MAGRHCPGGSGNSPTTIDDQVGGPSACVPFVAACTSLVRVCLPARRFLPSNSRCAWGGAISPLRGSVSSIHRSRAAVGPPALWRLCSAAPALHRGCKRTICVVVARGAAGQRPAPLRPSLPAAAALYSPPPDGSAHGSTADPPATPCCGHGKARCSNLHGPSRPLQDEARRPGAGRPPARRGGSCLGRRPRQVRHPPGERGDSWEPWKIADKVAACP